MWPILAVLVIAVVVIAALMPKQEAPAPQEGNMPTTEEGIKPRKIYGTAWIEAPTLVAFKKMGKVPIKSSGGKK